MYNVSRKYLHTLYSKMSATVSMPLFKSREEYERYRANQISGSGRLFGSGRKKGSKNAPNVVNPEHLEVSTTGLAPTENATTAPINEIIQTEQPVSQEPDYSKMTKAQLIEVATKKGIKNFGRTPVADLIELIKSKDPKKTRKEINQRKKVVATDTTKQSAFANVIPGAVPITSASENVGHEIMAIPRYIADRWKDDPTATPAPTRVSASEVFNTKYDTTGNTTYFLPPLDPNDPLIKKIDEWVKKKGFDAIPENNSRPGLGVGRTQKAGYLEGRIPVASRTAERKKATAEIIAKGIPTKTVMTKKGEVQKPMTAKERKEYIDAELIKMKLPILLKAELNKFSGVSQSKKKMLVEIAELIGDVGKAINPLRFTSIQINLQYEALKHYDRGNQGLSCIFAVGDYEGGDLVINGRPVSIKYQPLLFDGKNNAHLVKKILSGTRASFVMYEMKPKQSGFIPSINDEHLQSGEGTAEKVLTEADKEIVEVVGVEEPPPEAEPVIEHDFDATGEQKNEIVNKEDVADMNNIPGLRVYEMDEDGDYKEDEDNRTFYTAKSWNDNDDDNMSFYTALSGEGKRQHHYSVMMRLLDGAGLLPHMFPHMTGGKMEEHGKAGEARLNPPIKVAKGTVFNRKYEEDKLYELPALSKTDPDVKALTQYMMENELPINKSRVNSGIGRSQTVGKVRQKFKSTFNDSAFTKANPDLKTLLFNIGKKYNPLGFTSVQVNQNYECLPHIDKNNHGLSMIFAVGDYDGGLLYINDKPHNIAYKPLIFNGAKNLHYVSKITKGNRFSFVYFTTGKKKKT